VQGVARQLGLDEGLDSELLREAAALWSGWAAEDGRLGAVTGLAGLRPWLRVADPARADELLQVLARLASPSGGDSVPAAGVLAWVLLPGACSVARRLRSLSPQIDELVAAQLWIEVRSFPCQRLGKVAANILRNVRAAVMSDCGVRSQVQRCDRSWARTWAVDPSSPGWAAMPGPAEPVPAAEELAALLEWACRAEVIGPQDRSLLVCLAVNADRAGSSRARRSRSGLMATEVSAAVGEVFGLSPVSVRRRARRTMAVLSEACAEVEWCAA
jgi:hypothetical protein